MDLETVIYTTPKPHVAEIRLNRPSRLNAAIEALYDDLQQAIDEAETDQSIRVIILKGEGTSFCAGVDLKEYRNMASTNFQRRQYLQNAAKICKRLFELSKPVIAAVQGHAAGSGAELALSCDFILMADDAYFSFPESKLGTFVGGGATYHLPQRIGLTRAKELILLGEPVSALEALAMGLANQVIEKKCFADKVYDFALTMTRRAPASLRAAKEQLNNALKRDLETAILMEIESVMDCMATEDWSEGIQAFLEKRRPIFKGC